jgi:hypothetical protein
MCRVLHAEAARDAYWPYTFVLFESMIFPSSRSCGERDGPSWPATSGQRKPSLIRLIDFDALQGSCAIVRICDRG